MNLELECVIATDLKGNPKIKLTKDCAEVTIDVYTQDYNKLLQNVEKVLLLSSKE